jgi:Mg2+/Co2+ transporter CorB
MMVLYIKVEKKKVKQKLKLVRNEWLNINKLMEKREEFINKKIVCNKLIEYSCSTLLRTLLIFEISGREWCLSFQNI